MADQDKGQPECTPSFPDFSPARVLEHTSDGIAVLDGRGNILYSNPAMERIFGLAPQKNVHEMLPLIYPDPQVRNEVMELLRTGANLPNPFDRTLPFVHASGEKRWVRVQAFPIENGLIVFSASDETQSVVAEEALKESEARYRQIVQHAPTGIYEIDFTSGKFTSVNDLMCEYTGYTREELMEMVAFELLTEPSQMVFLRRIEDLIQGRSVPEMVEYEVRKKSGETFWGMFSTQQQYENGNLTGTSVVVHDITEKRKAERSLRESEERFRAIAETAKDWIFCKDKNFRYTYVNPAMCLDVGKEPEQILGTTSESVFDQDSASLMRDMDAPVLQGRISDREISLMLGGRKRSVHVIKVPLYDREGRFMGISGIVRDVTDRKRIQARLMEENAFREAIISRLAEGLCVCHDTPVFPYVRFTVWNDRMTDITGYTLEEINESGWYQSLYPDPDYRKRAGERMKRMRDGEDLLSEEWTVTRKDGQTRHVLISTSILKTETEKVHVLALMQDITDRKRMEEEIIRAEKLDSIGVLAGGVAHDFNNLLMGMQGNLSLAMLELPEGAPHRKRLKAVEQCIRDAAGLTRQLLGFARGGKYEVAPTDMNALIRKTASLFGRTRKEVSILSELRATRAVEVDQGQMEQVLVNLFVNAWQAMAEGGDLYIKTRDTALDETEARSLHVKPGDYVEISVSDTGAGMDPQTLKRAFDPFFTTKERSRGTGLGLSSADGIIKSHNGAILAESRLGEGSVFTIYLPASDKKIPESTPAVDGMPLGDETLLLVDDEEVVLHAVRDVLKVLGYRVILARSGREALETFQKETVDLVVLDIIMPDMSGGEVYERMKEIDPGVRVLLSSGYSVRDKASELIQKGCDGFIQKPYGLEEISRKIREILESRAS